MPTITTNADLLGQIESISCNGLDPLHTREALVLKLRQIYQLAVLADADGDDDGGDGNANSGDDE